MQLATTRRAALLGTSALALAGLAACTTTTTNGTTTITINVPELTAYISGGVALIAAFLAFPGVGGVIGATAAATITGLLGQVNTAIPAVTQAAGTSATFSFTTTSVPAFISSLEADGSTLLTDLNAAFTGAGAALPAGAAQYYEGAVVLLNAIAALFEINAAAAAPSKMTVAQALALVGIKAP